MIVTMRIVIAGGHGQIALRLLRLLTAAGHTGIGLVRNPAHLPDLEETGQTGLVCDLEGTYASDLAGLFKDADAIVFAAGAGPNSGVFRKGTVDQDAAILCADAAALADVRRFIQVSTAGAGTRPRPGTDQVWAAYIAAKTAAEEDLKPRDLDWTILRPGALTNDPGTGHVLLKDPPVDRDTVTRDDVAAVILALLESGTGIRRTLELRQGTTPIAEAVNTL